MTRDEAIEILRKLPIGLMDLTNEQKWDLTEAVGLALSALRPVSREQLEKMWRGEWKRDKWPSGTHRIICNRCGEWNGKTTNFCSHCGAPITDEAVEMVMERWEVFYD